MAGRQLGSHHIVNHKHTLGPSYKQRACTGLGQGRAGRSILRQIALWLWHKTTCATHSMTHSPLQIHITYPPVLKGPVEAANACNTSSGTHDAPSIAVFKLRVSTQHNSVHDRAVVWLLGTKLFPTCKHAIHVMTIPLVLGTRARRTCGNQRDGDNFSTLGAPPSSCAVRQGSCRWHGGGNRRPAARIVLRPVRAHRRQRRHAPAHPGEQPRCRQRTLSHDKLKGALQRNQLLLEFPPSMHCPAFGSITQRAQYEATTHLRRI